MFPAPTRLLTIVREICAQSDSPFQTGLHKARKRRLKYWDGTAWQPTTKYHEELKGKFTSPLAAASWPVNRIDVVGRGTDMAYYHKSFDGTGWQP
jgi:hypothetical protein